MITQFGYITIWSIVWPLAPIFALINNYIELRADAVKICKHVRRPVGERVETIGSWLETLVCIRSFFHPTSNMANYSEHHILDRSHDERNPNIPIPPNCKPSQSCPDSQPKHNRHYPPNNHNQLLHDPHYSSNDPPNLDPSCSSSFGSKSWILGPQVGRRGRCGEIDLERK